MSEYNTKKDPCKKFACQIQACLNENNYQESACAEALASMRRCCRIWKDKSICCSGIVLDVDSATSVADHKLPEDYGKRPK